MARPRGAPSAAVDGVALLAAAVRAAVEAKAPRRTVAAVAGAVAAVALRARTAPPAPPPAAGAARAEDADAPPRSSAAKVERRRRRRQRLAARRAAERGGAANAADAGRGGAADGAAAAAGLELVQLPMVVDVVDDEWADELPPRRARRQLRRTDTVAAEDPRPPAAAVAAAAAGCGGAAGMQAFLEEAFAAGVSPADAAALVSWCAAPGAPEAAPPAGDEGGPAAEGAAPALAGGAVVLDDRGLHCGPWGPRVVLGGSGTKFHFAFGSVGFSSGRHAWTISWRPLGGAKSGAPGRGGAAGLAREADAAVAVARGPGGAGAASTSQASPKSGCWPARGASDELATRFADWPTCIVFGMKQDVHDRRYVPWEGPAEWAGGAASSAPSIKFAIVLDFPSRTVTYVADGGQRRWDAPLPHSGAVHPVIAASGPHFFQIRYGMHL
ncbi:unnamed protein product [Prorocentrum cordatum]|uniref:B30.2/SPRY domain-containing protein n=1 Tax=Prorocentrum cordatum TaxID=2364126 RepID=A0ABN9VDY8_9DINO|nr:unnamed protein product [Polarella glacialis]